MSWTFPFSVTVAGNPVAGNAQSMTCDIQAKDPSIIYEEWGVQLNNPAVMYYRTSDASKVTVHARVTHGSVIYAVVSVPDERSASSSLAHVRALLERLEA
jgi:hypothetical protein